MFLEMLRGIENTVKADDTWTNHLDLVMTTEHSINTITWETATHPWVSNKDEHIPFLIAYHLHLVNTNLRQN